MTLILTGLAIIGVLNIALLNASNFTNFQDKFLRWITLLGVALVMSVLVVGGAFPAETVGGYDPSLGIEFTIDGDLKLLIFATFLIFTHFFLFIDHARAPLVLLLTSLLGVFTTNDLFNLFVWFELLLTASFVAPILAKPDYKAILKYAVPSVLSSAMFLIGIGILYKNSGFLNFPEIAKSIQHTNQTQIGLLFIAIAMLTKAGVVPFHFWLGAAYHRFNNVVFPVIYSTLSKVGLFALSKVINKSGLSLDQTLTLILVGVAFVSILVGFLLAYFESNIKRAFAFFSICKNGFMLACLLWADPGVFYAYLAYDTLFSYFYLISVLTDRNIPSTPLMFGWLGFPVSGFFLTNVMLVTTSSASVTFICIFSAFKFMSLLFLLKCHARKHESRISLWDSAFALISIILISLFSIYHFENA